MLDVTDDNNINYKAFTTTNITCLPTNINQCNQSDAISSHVIFNQIGKCILRKKHNIEGRSK